MFNISDKIENIAITVLICFGFLITFAVVHHALNAQSFTTQLSELSKLKKENLELKASFAQCNVNLIALKSSNELTTEQKKLVEEFSKELSCTYNWQLGKCDEVKNIPSTISTTTGSIAK